MSTQYRVRKKAKDYLASQTEFLTLIETAGTVFSDDYAIELVKDASGSLSFLDSKNAECQKTIQHAGQVFVPPDLESSVWRALGLASGREDYGETLDIFSQIHCLFTGCGLSDDSAQLCTYFVVASWFPEFLVVAPTLMLTGAEAEARTILQLLAALVRLALPLAEINLNVFDCVLQKIQPTLLIARVDPAMLRMLSASNHPHAYLSRKKDLIDMFCVKAAFFGPTLIGMGEDAAFLNVHCVPVSGSMPILNTTFLEHIAADFRPRLLDYRFKNLSEVRMTDFDAPTLPTPLRAMAHALGACIVEDPELQARIVRLLESQRAVQRAGRLIDLNCVFVEALLAKCHSEIGPVRLGVSELAATATSILGDRGETATLEPKRASNYLKQIGVIPERDSKGFSIHLAADIRRLIHKLARDLQVLDSVHVLPACQDCSREQSVGV